MQSYNLSNIQGDTLLTTDGTGTNTSTGTGPANSFIYDPFGNAIPGGNIPSNSDRASLGYEGSHLKITETDFTLTPIQMGARVYLPTIGRFTSLDPVVGGNANGYVYPLDPVDGNDLTGDFSINLNSLRKARNTAYRYNYNATRVAAAGVYGLYYTGYRMNKNISQRPAYRGLQFMRPAGWALQGVGLSGDVALDIYKRYATPAKHESILDEHTWGNINPLHGPNAPNNFWLPGLYGSGKGIRADWAW